nr:ATP-binding protein [Anaerolineae bacterium]
KEFIGQLETRHQKGLLLPEWLRYPMIPFWLGEFIQNIREDPMLQPHQWLLKLWISQGFLTTPDPEWALELRDKFEAGIAHQFILHFNVTDYVFDMRYGFEHRLPSYLVARYPQEDGRDVLFYNRSQGVTPAADRQADSLSREENSRWQNFLSDVSRWGLRANDLRVLMNPAEALYALEQSLYESGNTCDPNSVVIFEFAEKVAPAGGIEFHGGNADLLIQIETLQRWALDERIRLKGHLILLLARNIAEVSDNLREANGGTEAIEVPMPDDSARLKYISYLFYHYLRSAHPLGAREICFDAKDFSIDPKSVISPIEQQLRALANLTAGLTRVAIQDIVLRAFQAGTPITAKLVQERKESTIRSETRNLLEVLKPSRSMDAVGGLEKIKAFLRTEVLQSLKSRNPNTPAGILFLGPPGTGKTLVAEGLAYESGVNFVKLGNFRDQFVGQSERNLSRALNIIRAMTPVIVFIDELDQSEGRRSEGNLDSGVSSRVFAKLLEVMSDESLRGKVVWIAASNRPDLIDDAMRRPGRFDDKIPFLVPTEEERASIFAAILRHKGKLSDEDINTLALDMLARESNGFTGAEIEVIVSRALRKASIDNVVLQTQHLKEAVKGFIKSVNSEKYRLMTLLALAEVNNIALIPDPREHPQLEMDWISVDGTHVRINQATVQQEIKRLKNAIL